MLNESRWGSNRSVGRGCFRNYLKQSQDGFQNGGALFGTSFHFKSWNWTVSCHTHWAQQLAHNLPNQYMLIGICWFWWTTSWWMWWCIRCLGKAIFRFINDLAAVYADEEHPGDCRGVLDAWAKQYWGVQLYKWFAVASWLLCGSAHPQILRSCKKIMIVNTYIYWDSLVLWLMMWVLLNLQHKSLWLQSDRKQKECKFSYVFVKSIC